MWITNLFQSYIYIERNNFFISHNKLDDFMSTCTSLSDYGLLLLLSSDMATIYIQKKKT